MGDNFEMKWIRMRESMKRKRSVKEKEEEEEVKYVGRKGLRNNTIRQRN